MSWLVLGASGQVGHFVLQRLAARDDDVVAVSRGDPPAGATARVRWIRGDLFRGFAPPDATTIVSAGPLDGLAAWLERGDLAAPRRLVALSSTSVQTKLESPDPNERALVARLRLAEQTVEAWCERHRVDWTLLRPTLVYGCGLDRNLTPIARRARRFGFHPLPRAFGLRQPVHADDVAAACIAAAESDEAMGKIYAIPGAETLEFGEMIGRVLRCVDARAMPVPRVLLRATAALAPLGVGGAAAVARLEQDLLFDASPARRDFGYAPRAFAPQASMF